MKEIQETIILSKKLSSIVEQEIIDSKLQDFLIENKERISLENENVIGTPIFEAAMLGKWNYVKILFNENANIDVAHSSNKWSFLHEAILNAPENIWQAILEEIKEGRVQHTLARKETTLGYTPIMLAYTKKRYDRFKDLFAIKNHNLGLLEKNKEGNSLSHLACLNNDLETIKEIIERKGVFNIRNKANKMAFELTTSNEILSLLIEKNLVSEWSSPENTKENTVSESNTVRSKETKRLLPKLVRC